jgi:hypothetical protein
MTDVPRDFIIHVRLLLVQEDQDCRYFSPLLAKSEGNRFGEIFGIPRLYPIVLLF